MRRPSNRTLLAGTAAIAIATGATLAAARAAAKRWAAAHDPTDGEPLCLPEGREEKVATSDGAVLAAIVAGPDDATTFVLAHCWTGDRRVWGPVARRLVAKGHRVVLYDQRGHGDSTVGAAGLTLDALADDLRAVVEHFEVRDAVVAGHSMGGMAVQSFALRHPEVLEARVKGLGLVATACDKLGQGSLADRIAARAVGSTRLDRFLSNPRLAPYMVRNSVGRTATLSHLRAVAETFVATAPATRAGFLGAMQQMDFREALADLDVPTVVAVGTRDRLTPLSLGKRLADAVPSARLEVLDDAGHMLPCEEPDRIAELLAGLA